MPIELRTKRYFAYLDVPADVRQKLGRRVYRQTLKTDSHSVAKRRAAPLIEQWKREIDRARGQPSSDDASFWRRKLREAKTPADRTSILDQVEMAAWEIGAVNVDQIGQAPWADAAARQFYAESTGALVPTTEHLDEWIGALQVKDKTAAMRKTAINRMAAKFPMLKDVTRPEVRRWVTTLLTESKAATVQRMTSDCRNYWRYLVTIQAAPEDSAPFDRLGLKVKNISWLPFDPVDVVKLLDRATREQDSELADLIRLAMYSGARREELCRLEIAHVRNDSFDIVDAKTSAGVRTVPIHGELAQTMARLIDGRKAGFLLPGEPNKNGQRGDMLGKRFTRLKKALGFDQRRVFHSLRGTVITMLERAGVPEGTVQDIVGHERSTLTGSTYSGKSTLAMRADALARLVYLPS